MKKYKITTAKKAVQNGLVKIGDKIWIEGIVESTDYEKIGYKPTNKIRIPIPEQKPIDFGEAGRVLKSGNLIVKTTGHSEDFKFSAYVLKSEYYPIGEARYDWIIDEGWTDITDTYNKEQI